jgi:hypothetical protein
MLVIVSYAVYLSISAALTLWVGRTLFNHGRLFLVDIFRGNQALADSVNRLLLVGFYLVNFGYVVLALSSSSEVTTTRAAVEALSVKVGVVLLVLGALHYANLYVLGRIRRRVTLDHAPPPVSGEPSCTVLPSSTTRAG